MSGMAGLREEAIQSILTRYDANDVHIYEVIIRIESGMFDYLKQQEKKSQEQRRLENQNKPKNLQQARSDPQQKRQAPGQSRTYRSVPQRPTMKFPASKKGKNG